MPTLANRISVAPGTVQGIVLIGIEGAGKTRLARLIGKMLGWFVTDADHLTTGIPYEDVVQLNLDDVRRARADELERIFSTPQTVRRVVATTLRPLRDYERLDPDLKKRLKETWLLVHIEPDLHDVAHYFVENPGARLKRPRLNKAIGFRGIYDELVGFKGEMEPLYSELRHAYVSLGCSQSTEASALRILTALVARFLPGVPVSKGPKVDGRP